MGRYRLDRGAGAGAGVQVLILTYLLVDSSNSTSDGIIIRSAKSGQKRKPRLQLVN